jgi:hypothetical protein
MALVKISFHNFVFLSWSVTELHRKVYGVGVEHNGIIFTGRFIQMGQLDGLKWGHEFSHCPFTSQAYFFLSSNEYWPKYLFLLFEMETFFCMFKESVRHKSLYTHNWVCYTPLFLHPFMFLTVLIFKNTADCWTVSLLIDKLSFTASQIQHTLKQNSDTRPKTF